MHPLQEKKIMYASSSELLAMLLEDTDFKFKRVIYNWKLGSTEGKVKGNEFCNKIIDNLVELRTTLNTSPEGATEDTKAALERLFALYGFLSKQISISIPRNDVSEIEKCHEIFKTIMEMFAAKK